MPESTVSPSAMSSTVRATSPSNTKGPGPNPFGRMTSGTRPSDCLNPTTPHHAAGMRADPPPSVASAKATMPSATAAALPPEEPPLLRSGAKGLPVGPKSGLSHTPLNPRTGLFVLPSTIAPAASMRSTHEQLKSIVRSWSAGMPPNVDGQPGLKSKRSFIAVGTPCSGPIGPPLMSVLSAARARSSASSIARWTNAFSVGLRASIRRAAACTASTGEICRARIAAATSAADA